MLTLANPVEPRTRPSKLALISLGLHLCVLAILIHHRAAWIAPMRMPGTEQGTQMEIEYLPGKAPIQTPLQTATQPPKPEPQQTPAIIPLPQLPILAAEPAPSLPTKSPAVEKAASTAGNDALGSGNLKIASTTFSPSPEPDLSTLPRGTRGDVILDIVIDTTGNIASIKMTSGLGHGIDESVITTVQHWTFHPATKDGQPVASEQELHFHYETRA